ncbi:MAG TPA: Rieske 2Fe-2S domain-containing protein [Mycobacteriales bacterium]|nr:Rieske 2Fe-2S domain-containing protein [Mycobacteriales bacterium]HWB65866.1 Rieske 2Fe-2S domain-containing protein [Mycobacteriales bacterium]
MPVGAGNGVTEVVDRLENAGHLDPAVGVVRRILQQALRSQRGRDLLHGVWLGHPLHPMLTDVPIGCWTAAAVLDALPGTGHGAGTLIATGCAAYVPTVAAGWADWSQLHEQQQRVGLVHAAVAGVAFTCYGASLAARARGRSWRGKAWSYSGLAVIGVAGYLGGHLAYRQAAGVNHVEAVPHLFPDGWHSLGPIHELPDGELCQREVDGVDLLVVRRGQHVDVLADTCSHLAAPLSEGSFAAEQGQGCVVCPWHGSTFRLADGAVVHGPATAPIPRFATRIIDGVLEVSLPDAG